MSSEDWILKNFLSYYDWKDLEKASGLSKPEIEEILSRGGKEHLTEEDLYYIKEKKSRRSSPALASDLGKTIRAVRRGINQTENDGRIVTHFGLFQRQERSPKNKRSNADPGISLPRKYLNSDDNG